MKTFKILTIIGIISFALFSFTSVIQDEWTVPDKYVNMENPIDANTDKAIGKSLYSKHCIYFLGNEGYGDGSKA